MISVVDIKTDALTMWRPFEEDVSNQPHLASGEFPEEVLQSYNS